MRSTDNGANWSVAFALGASVNAVHFVDPMVGHAVGPNGFITRTEDGGQSWTPQWSGITTALNDVHFVDANNGLAVGFGGTILRTVNGGATWAPATVPAAPELFGVRFATSSVVVAVGASGARLRSENGGSTWTRLDTPVFCSLCDLHDVTFVDADKGFAVGGESNAIMRTLDGGLTWAKLFVAGGSGPGRRGSRARSEPSGGRRSTGGGENRCRRAARRDPSDPLGAGRCLSRARECSQAGRVAGRQGICGENFRGGRLHGPPLAHGAHRRLSQPGGCPLSGRCVHAQGAGSVHRAALREILTRTSAGRVRNRVGRTPRRGPDRAAAPRSDAVS